ncbi:MAG: hypothetical protein QOK38_983 [Acidobacteriaceae bacterium]|jgi:hypothetical protein|nr:hypothetical protein [Acidobacteriaceae bacterium]
MRCPAALQLADIALVVPRPTYPLGRGFRWRKLLETGVYGTVEEIAEAEKTNSSYVGRLLRLTLLAPEIVEAILDGRQPTDM